MSSAPISTVAYLLSRQPGPLGRPEHLPSGSAKKAIPHRPNFRAGLHVKVDTTGGEEPAVARWNEGEGASLTFAD